MHIKWCPIAIFMATWLLIDGSNLAFRSFYGISETLTSPDGFPTNAIHGWMSSIMKLREFLPHDHGIVSFDIARSQKRLKMLESYKSNRVAQPESLKQQLPLIKELSEQLGYAICESSEAEADDLLASVAQLLTGQNETIFIASSDKDFAQCVCDTVTLIVPSLSGWQTITSDGVREKFGVNPEQIVDFLSLTGDSADCIPGIPGVGPKTAAQWLQKYPSINDILTNISSLTPERFREILPQHALILQRNQSLIKLDTNALQTLPALPTPNLSKAQETLKKLHLLSALKKLNAATPADSPQLSLF